MGQWRNSHLNPPFWYRPAPRKKRSYDLEVLPKRAQAAAEAWASDFARLTTHEQRAIVYRMVTEWSRQAARRAGRPDPIWVEAIVKPLNGGGYVLVDTKPLRSEYGGDGRTIENTRREAPRSTDNFELRMAAERIQAQLAERGISVVVDEPAPDPPVVPKRKAS